MWVRSRTKMMPKLDTIVRLTKREHYSWERSVICHYSVKNKQNPEIYSQRHCAKSPAEWRVDITAINRKLQTDVIIADDML